MCEAFIEALVKEKHNKLIKMVVNLKGAGGFGVRQDIFFFFNK